ncbi:MAG: CinA family protein [Hyphomicrobiaceae bacterium]|nr:CinA family protein [Hyphomicrobiaceae bacterium]
MFPDHLRTDAEQLLAMLRQRGLSLATAESCTGGLIAALITDIPGSSDVFDRGFVTYSNDAKTDMLGVRSEVLTSHGAVSREAALAMAEGALLHSISQIAIAVTGLAGPGGGTREKPVGLVHLAAARIGSLPQHREYRFGPLSREAIRIQAVEVALALIRCAADAPACE